MKRSEFLDKVYFLTNQLAELVDELPNIPSIDESIDNYEESKMTLSAGALQIEMDAEQISDLYFEAETETV